MTFYRFHWADCPEFSADNAWSVEWGHTRIEGSSTAECVPCDGTGELVGEPCDACDGEGVIECDRGYSACESAEDLLHYFAQRGDLASADEGRVIVFEGERVGTGCDGEPLVVPHTVIKVLAWSEFAEEAAVA